MTTSARSERLNMRLTPEKLATWRGFAEAEGRTLTEFVELAVDGYIELVQANVRHDARKSERARRLHALDPTVARRRDWGRLSDGGAP